MSNARTAAPEGLAARDAGSALDALVAGKVMGEVLTVPHEQALAMVGVYYVRSTGNPFSLDVPGRGPTSLAIPRWGDIPGHPSDYNTNARYFRYVAQHLLSLGGDVAARVEREVAACRVTPQPYSTDIAAAWLVVERVQMLHPGWRFSLLGGDVSFGYTHKGRGPGRYVVDKTRREAFGWRASFFGDEDPTKNYGQRHADEGADTPALAICRAALAIRSEDAA